MEHQGKNIERKIKSKNTHKIITNNKNIFFPDGTQMRNKQKQKYNF